MDDGRGRTRQLGRERLARGIRLTDARRLRTGACGIRLQAIRRRGEVVPQVRICAGAVGDDRQHVDLQVNSQCENIRVLANRLPRLDSFEEIKNGFGGQLHLTVKHSLKGCCSGCVVPSAMFKAMQIVAGLALPVDAQLQFSRPVPNGGSS